MIRTIASVLVAAALLVGAAPLASGAENLFAADPTFKYEVVSSEPVPGGTLHTVKLVSQKWHDVEWEHWLRVIVPAERKHAEAAVLIIGGGRNRSGPPRPLSGAALGLPLLAAEMGTVVAYLEQVPNQPLFGNLREDALIAYTFQKYLETKDETWPALVPMVRSAKRAMDAIQDLTAKGGEGKKVEKFFVTGASKRGWTTWLAAANDERVAAIAPMVIDVLNMREQMPHQVATFGDYSEQIEDYTSRGLAQMVADPEARRLLEIVDPWLSKERLALPKFIVLGTNDPYWPVDAVNNYFDGLPGEKYIHYVPNAGHGLEASAATTIATFFRAVLEGETRPRFRFAKEKGVGGALSLVVTAEDAPARAALWTAKATTRDFRKAQWSSAPLEVLYGRVAAPLAGPADGYAAAYIALTYRDASGREISYCTPIQMVGGAAKKKRAAF